MKTIEVNDDMYEFLMDLSHELNTQDRRITADPYFYQIQIKQELPTSEYYTDKYVWVDEDGDEINDNYIKLLVFEVNEWDIDNPEHDKLFDSLHQYDIDDILEDNNYRKVYIQEFYTYENVFLTEKACKKHIKLNGHNYTEPRDYVSHGYRNPEMETLIKFLRSLNKQTDEN